MGALTFPGLATGIDTAALVRQLVAAESVQRNALVQRQSIWRQKSDAFGQVETALGTLQDAVDELRDAGALRAFNISSSDEDVFTASAASSASEGFHEIIVNRLASAQRDVHDGINPTETWTNTKAVVTADTEYFSAAEISDNLGTDYKFVFQFGDETQVVVDLSPYDATGITLNELVTEINTAAGYTAASAYQDGEGYKLRVQAQIAGEGKGLVITDDDSVGGLDSTDDFVQDVDGDVGSDALVGAGDFVYTYDDEERIITTAEETSLGELRDLINNDAGNPGVTASILEHSAGGDQVFHLVLSGDDSGSDYTITIDDVKTTLDGTGGTVDFRSTAFTNTQQAQDSQIRVDGYPAADWIERSGNTIDDVLPGVTLNLKSTGTANVTLNRNTEDLKEKIDDMVDAYNGVMTLIDELTAYNADEDTGGILIGEISLRNISQQLRTIFIETAPGFKDGVDSFTLPGQIGLELDSDGTLKLYTDAETRPGAETTHSGLNDAISEDYDGVLQLLGAYLTGSSDSNYLKFFAAAAVTESGAYTVKATFSGGELTGAQIKLAGESESAYRDADIDGNLIVGKKEDGEGDPYPEAFLQVIATWDGVSATQTTEVRVRQGLGGKLYEQIDLMLDSTDGAISLAVSRCQSTINQLEDHIEDQEERLENMGERLTLKFARLEQMLMMIESQRVALGFL